MQADLAAGEEQEATQTDEVLPHGLVSVITAQNAFTWERPADGGEPQPVDTSMLQVKYLTPQVTSAVASTPPCCR